MTMAERLAQLYADGTGWPCLGNPLWISEDPKDRAEVAPFCLTCPVLIVPPTTQSAGAGSPVPGGAHPHPPLPSFERTVPNSASNEFRPVKSRSSTELGLNRRSSSSMMPGSILKNSSSMANGLKPMQSC